jgi:hypothetical protein
MKSEDIANAILFIKPNTEFTITGDELTWLDENQTQPTDKEIEAGWIAYQAAQEAEAQAKAQAKATLLERLGLTQEEFNTLIA